MDCDKSCRKIPGKYCGINICIDARTRRQFSFIDLVFCKEVNWNKDSVKLVSLLSNFLFINGESFENYSHVKNHELGM